MELTGRNATTHVGTVLTKMFVTIPTVHVQRAVRLVTLTTTVKHVNRQSVIYELKTKVTFERPSLVKINSVRFYAVSAIFQS